MKVCKSCLAEKSEDAFRVWRKDCRECEKERHNVARRAKRAFNKATPPTPILKAELPEFEITEVPPPPPSPLEQALKASEEARNKRDLKREHSALVSEVQKLKTTISELVKMQQAPEVIVYDKPAWERMDAIAFAIGSDMHVEEPVDKDSVHGLNEYNLEIARSRVEHFFRNLLRLTDIAARDSKITTINLDLLGDNFSGWIHEELLSSCLLAPGDAARFWKGLIFAGVDFLLKESSYIIQGDMIPGNHGRMTDKIHVSDPTGTSLETFAYHSIADRYEGNPRVRLVPAAKPVVYRKYFENFTIRKLHGYEVKYGGGVGGLTIPLNKAIAMWDRGIRADLTILGHFHQLFDGGSFLANGSVIGYNLFAQAIRASFEEARQAFYLVHARNGGTRCGYSPIWLDDAHVQKEQLCAS